MKLNLFSKLVFGSICIGASLLFFGGFVSAGSTNLLGMQDLLQSWADSANDQGSHEHMQESLEWGNLYESAHKMAQNQVAKPALEALKETHYKISGYCDGDLEQKHTEKVFANMPYARQLRVAMGARDIIDGNLSLDFSESCVEVYKCYFSDSLKERGVDLDEFDEDDYSNTILQGCSDIVTREYDLVHMTILAKETQRNANYGDDVFMNGSLDDSPYDLLATAQRIGDLLFLNNDEPTEIAFFDNDRYKHYEGEADPDKTDEVEYEDPEEWSREERITPVEDPIPDEITGTYAPDDEPPEGRGPERTNAAGIGGGSVSANEMCIPEEPEEESEGISEAEAAEREWEATYERNFKFDMDTILAVELGSRVAPNVERAFGEGDIPPEGADLQEEASQQASEIADDLFENSDQAVEETKNKIQECVEEFTGGDPGAWKKTLWKSLTQPTAFTKCVLGNLCKEQGDDSGLGIFRIKICTTPTYSSYNVGGGKKVKSVEEIMDELTNICVSLRDGGELVKHNKTKGHWTHKLMNLKWSDLFSFGISVSVGTPPTGWEDRANQQKKLNEQNKFLTNYSLGFHEDLTFQQEKNKYNILHDPVVANVSASESTSDAQVKANVFRGANEIDRSGQQEYIEKEQLQKYSETNAIMDTFIRENFNYWKFIGGHTNSMQKVWSATYEEFKNSQ